MPQKTRFSNDLSQGKRNQQYPSTLLIAVLAAVLGILPALYRWTVRALLRRNLRHLREGDLEPLFSTYADNIRFVFPGKNSWAGEFRGKAEVKRRVRRVSQGCLRLEPHEMLVAGPPWDTTFALRFTDQCTPADGTVVYANRGMSFAKIGSF